MITQELAAIARLEADTVNAARMVVGRPLRIALVGPDGVGKSSAITALKEWFREGVPELTVIVRQWRPGLLPDLGAFLGKPSTPGQKTPPRRVAGQFHTVRILYYFLDFLIGGWWNDKWRAPARSLILYDRCALDMLVDPVRFGLRSGLGTRLLWKMTPRPDLLILLHDDPDRILERKQELQRHEMSEQLNTWLDLVRSGDVDHVIRVDGQAGEIAARIRNLVLDTMIRKNSPGDHEQPHNSLEWLGGILSGQAPGAVLTAEPPPRTVEAARYAVLPSSRNARFLVPLGKSRPAARALEIYNAQTFRAKAGKFALELGLRAGLAQPLLRDRRWLWMAGGLPLQEHLREVIGCGKLTCAISIGTPNLSQKPVLQLMDDDGEIVGYAKAGWNKRTIALVQTEADTLTHLADVPFRSAGIPRVLHAGFWKGNYLLVQSAAQVQLGASPAYLDTRHLEFLVDLHRVQPMPVRLAWSHFDAGVSDKLNQLGRSGLEYYAHLLEAAVHTCRKTLGDSPVPSGYGHGDFAPWNIRLEKDRLLVVDWEYGGPRCPPLWDLFHFHIGASIELRDHSASEIYRQLTGPGRVREQLLAYCNALTIPTGWIEPLLVAYLCEALSAKLLLEGALPGRKDQRVRATIGGLLAILCRPGAHL